MIERKTLILKCITSLMKINGVHIEFRTKSAALNKLIMKLDTFYSLVLTFLFATNDDR